MKKNLDGLTAIAYVLMFLGIQGLASAAVLVVANLTGKGRADGLDTTGTVVSMLLFSVLTVAVFTGLRWFRPSRSYVRSRPWAVLCWCVVAAVGAVVPSMFLQETLLPAWPSWLKDIVEQAERQTSLLLATRWGYVVVCLVAPVVEEMVFRGAALRSLLSWRPGSRWAMIALSALLFALAHINPAQMPHAFAVGLLLGWMFQRTGSIVPGVAYHWANNTVAYVLSRLYPDPSLRLVDVLGDNRHVLMAVGCSLLILLPALFQLDQRMRPAGDSRERLSGQASKEKR